VHGRSSSPAQTVRLPRRPAPRESPQKPPPWPQPPWPQRLGHERRLNLVGRDDDDGALGAHVLAHPAADARPAVNEFGEAVELVARQGQAVKRANVDAEIAARAAVGVDHGLGPVGPARDAGQPPPVLVFDGVFRAHVRASMAVDAQGRIDNVQFLALARNALHGTNLHARGAAGARVGDIVRHAPRPLEACNPPPVAVQFTPLYQPGPDSPTTASPPRAKYSFRPSTSSTSPPGGAAACASASARRRSSTTHGTTGNTIGPDGAVSTSACARAKPSAMLRRSPRPLA